MSSAPRVSVVTPFLDPPVPFFREAIESVLAQTFQGWELLLVNDGSGSEATDVAEEFAEAHPGRIRVIEPPGTGKQGASAVRNLGIQEASGDLVAFLDADDSWLPMRLEKHVRLLERHVNAAMVCGPSLFWISWSTDPKGAEHHRDFVPPLGVRAGLELPPPGILPVFLSGRGAVPCTNAVTARRGVVLEIGGWEDAFPGLYDDQVLLSKVLLRRPMVATDTALDRYRQHGSSMTATAGDRAENEARKRFLNWLLAHMDDGSFDFPEVRRAARREIWSLEHPVGGRILRMIRRLRSRLVPSASSEGR